MAKSYKELKSSIPKTSGESPFRREYNEKKRLERMSYQELKSEPFDFYLDQEYINTFIKDSQDHLKRTQEESKGVTYGNVNSIADSYDKRADDLRTRASNIRVYLNANKGKIDESAYKELMSYLDDYKTTSNKYSVAFHNSKNYYSQWEDEESYNRAYDNYIYSKKYEGKTYADMQKAKGEVEENWMAEKGFKSQGGAADVLNGALSSTMPSNKIKEQFPTKPNEVATKVMQDKGLKEKTLDTDLDRELYWIENHITDKQFVDTMTDDELSYYKEQSVKGNLHYDSVLYYDDVGAVTIDQVIRDREMEKISNGVASNPEVQKAYDAAISAINDYDDALSLYNDLYDYHKSVTSDGYFHPTEEQKKTFERLRAKYGKEYDLDINHPSMYTQEQLSKLQLDLQTTKAETAEAFDSVSGYSMKDIEHYLKERESRANYNDTQKEYSDYASENFFTWADAKLYNMLIAPIGSISNLVENKTEEYVYGYANVYDDEHINQMSAFSSTTSEMTGNAFEQAASWLGASPEVSAIVGDVATIADSGISSAIQSQVIAVEATILTGGNAAAGEILALGIMGTQAAANTYSNAIKNGSTNEEATTIALISGVVEALMEKIPLDKFMDAVGGKTTVKNFVQYLKTMLKQSGIEGLEELGTEVLTTIADEMINGDHSNYQTSVNMYMKQGFSETDAKKMATTEWLQGVVEAFLGGAIGGGVGGVVQNTLAYNNTQNYYKGVGSEVVNRGNVGDLVSQAQSYTEGNKALKKLADKVANANIENMSKHQSKKYARNVGELYNIVSEKQAKNIRKSITEELKAHNVNASAKTVDVLLKYAQGEKLTATEQMVFDNNKGAYVLDNVAYKMAQKSTKPTTETVDGVNADTFEGANENTEENDFEQTTYNGEAISFKYKSPDTVELDNGETVSVEDITMSDDDAVFYDAIMGENDFFPEARFVNGKLTSGVDIYTANAIRKIFGGTPTINQLKGVKMYYHYGMYNIKRFGESGALTEAQEKQVFNLGRAFGEYVAEKESNTPKVKKYSKGKIKYNVKSELNSRQQASVEVVEKLADMFNITFNLYESTLNENGERSSVMPNGEKTTANGYYMNGEIYIDINAGNKGQGAMLYTVAHELTHYIREWSPKKFKILADFLVEQYESKGKSVDYYVNKQMEKARKSGNKNMKYSEAFEEFVADSMEKMLTDQNAVEKLAMLRTKDKSVFDKLREGIQKLVDKVKQEYAKLTPDSAEGRIVATMTDVFSDIQDLFLEALDDASTNFQKAEKNTAINDGVRYSFREKSNGNNKMIINAINENIDSISNHNKFSVESEEIPEDISKSQYVYNIFKEQGGYAKNSEIGTVELTYAGAKSTVFHGFGNEKLAAVKAIKDVIENGDIIQETTNYENNGVDRIIIVAKGTINKTPAYVGVVIRRFYNAKTSRNSFYLHEALIEKTDSHIMTGPQLSGDTVSESVYDNSVSQENTTVNNNSMQENENNAKVKFSERGTNQVDYEQITKSFSITKPNDYIHVQRQVFDTLKNEGFFTSEDKSSRIDYNEDSGMVIETNKSGIKETFNGDNYSNLGKVKKALKLATIRKLPEIIKNGKLVDNDVNNYHNDSSSTKFAYIQSTIDINGNAISVKIDIKKSPQKNKFWVHSVQILEKANEQPAVASRVIKQANDSLAYENSVPNSIENVNENSIKFSERGQTVYELLGENKKLQKDNERLKEKVKYLNQLLKLQRKVTHGKIIDRRSTETQARKIIKSTGTKIELSNLTDQLYAFYTLIIGSEQLVWDDVLTRASWIADDIINAIPQKTQRDEYAQEVLSYIRSKNIRLNDVQRAEVENIYDSYNAYRKRLMGSITISNNGTSLDSVWQDLAEQYPDTFSKDTNPADMPLELADIISSLREAKDIIEEFDSAEQIRWLAEQVYDSYWDVSTVESVMDKMSKEHRLQINELKAQHEERVQKIRDKHQEELDNQKAYYRDMVNRVRQRSALSHKKQMLDYQDKVHEAQARAIEKRNNTETRRQILKTLDKIDARLTRGTKEKNIGLEMQPLACRLLTLVNLDTVDADYRIDRLNLEMEHTRNPQTLNALQARIENIKKQGEKKADELQRKRNKYKTIAATANKTLQEIGKEVSIDEVITKTLDDIENLVEATPIRRMTSYQLECLKNAVNMVDGYIRADKQLFIDGKKQNVEVMANAVMNEVLGNSKKEKQFIKQLEWVNKFGWSMLKPETAFDLIGSSSLSKLFQEARKGDDQFARSVSDAQAFLSENVKKYGADKWNMDERKEFNIQGEKVTLTLGEILSLYAYSKREQAIPHLESGGFVQVEPVKKKIGGKINIEYTVYEDHAHRISEVELGSIINALTKEQVAFADVMQEYLSTVMGAKGNEISRELYQIDLFKEKFYFPLKLHSTYKWFQTKENTGEPKLKNIGMTKPIVQKANDPIVLESFENVWANHVVQMSRYNAYVLGIETLDRVFGYRGLDKSSSLRAALEGAFGKSANEYIENFITDLNGGRKGSKHKDMVNIASKLVSTFKKVTVSASLSTAIQQPSSVIRAMSYVKPKYFMMRSNEKISHKDNWAELKKYAPIATLKEIGGYDMSSGINVADFIKHRDYKGKEKFIALVKDSNYRDEVLMWGASKGDELAWSALWNAIKKEQRHRFPNMEKEKFLKICGQRFTDVATKTQVYDSVFTRSEIMRSPSETNKMATAFMGEPMTNLNIIIDSIIQAKRGKISKKQAAWNIGCVYAAQFVAAGLASAIYAMRDDDEDESFWEKYVQALSSKTVDEVLFGALIPINSIPYIRDLYSMIGGYDVARTDMSVFADLIKSFKKLDSDSLSNWEKISGFAGSFAAAFGLPLKNLLRDGEAIYNLGVNVFDDNVAQKGDTGKAIIEGIFGEKTMSDANEYLAKGKMEKANKLIADLLEEKTENNISNGKTQEKAEKDAKSSIRSSLTSYWKPLFIKAYQEDDYIEQEEIYERLHSTGIYGTSEELEKTIEKWIKDLQ